MDKSTLFLCKEQLNFISSFIRAEKWHDVYRSFYELDIKAKGNSEAEVQYNGWLHSIHKTLITKDHEYYAMNKEYFLSSIHFAKKEMKNFGKETYYKPYFSGPHP